MILARIDGRDEAYSNYIKNYIQKNFKFFIHLKESILVFPKSDDRTKRQFFLDCLLNNLNKTKTSKTSIDFNMDVPFFVEFSDSKEGYLMPKVIVKCHRDNVFFRFSDETKRVVEFLRKSFFGMRVDVDYFQKVAKIPIKSKEEYSLLRKLLSKKVKFSDFLQVKFAYNEEELIRLHSDTKSSKQSRFYNPHSENTELTYLRELNCHIGDSFDTVRQRYLELIKIYHPDRVYGKDEEIVRRYTEKFRRVQNAFEALKKMRFAMAS
jgi:molecular chaperone DnaJ